MTSKEISAVRERVTEIYKIVWHEMNEASHNEFKIKAQYGEDSAEYDDASDITEYWKNAKRQLSATISDLLHLQCDAAEKDLCHEIGK